MKGWLNFAEPCVTNYNDGTSFKRRIRHSPESFGIAPPLICGPIIIGEVRLGYVNAMRVEWAATMLSGQSLDVWKVQAENVRVEYHAKGDMVPEVDDGASIVEDEEYEEEWCGITCLRGGSGPIDSDTSNEASEQSESCGSDAPSVHRASYVPEAASTPRRDSIVQFPTPVSIQRPQLVIGLPTNLRPPVDGPWGARLVAPSRPEGYSLEGGNDIQSAGVDRETPRYGKFTCEIVFWHIPAGEEEDFNDTTDAQWVQVLRGQTAPGL